METQKFYYEVTKNIEKYTQDELTNFVKNIIRKFPKNKYEEILLISGSGEHFISEETIKKKIAEINNAYREIDERELTFFEENYEIYSEGIDEWEVRYLDKDSIGPIIDKAVKFAMELVNLKKYNYAKYILELVLKAPYCTFNEITWDIEDFTLEQAYINNFITVGPSTICAYIIYIICQTSPNRVQEIHNLFKQSYYFQFASIEDAFGLGVEPIRNWDEFLTEWQEVIMQDKE